MIELFVALERAKSDIADEVMERLERESRTPPGMSEAIVRGLVEQVIEGYGDILVTGESEAMDPLFRALSRILVARGLRFSFVFEVPHLIEEVFRGELAKQYGDSNEDDAVSKFNEALDRAETTARKAACRFLDVFQEDLAGRIQTHNAYLKRLQTEFGVPVTEFSLATEAV
jgi:hypothetical protein